VCEHLQRHGILAAHKLNHILRKLLGGRVPCSLFNSPDRIHFSKRQRKQAYESITDFALELTAAYGQHPASAWRTAVLTWLQMNNLITIQHPYVSPCFSPKCAH
jgi:hypothetical protein